LVSPSVGFSLERKPLGNGNIPHTLPPHTKKTTKNLGVKKKIHNLKQMGPLTGEKKPIKPELGKGQSSE